MSTKIYNGYRFKNPVTVQEIQSFTQRLREKVTPLAKQMYCSRIYKEMINVYDLNQYGYDCEAMYFINQRNSTLYTGVREYYDARIKHIQKTNQRDSEADFSFSICIIPLQSKNSTLILLYTEKKELREAFEEMTEVEDYHYQNQTDQPEDISEEDWNIRSKDWDEALDDHVPMEVGLEYHPYTPDKFNFYTFHELKDWLEANLSLILPIMEDRARALAKREMMDEWDKTHPIEIKVVDENATREEKEAAKDVSFDRYWKYVAYSQTDEAIKIRIEKSEIIKRTLKPFLTTEELYKVNFEFHPRNKELLAKPDAKPYWLD